MICNDKDPSESQITSPKDMCLLPKPYFYTKKLH